MRTADLKLVWVMVVASVCGVARGAESKAVELTRLQEAYQARVESELRPLRDKYVEALVALEKKLAASGKLDAAGQVRAERETILRSKIYAPGFAPTDREVKVETSAALTDFLEWSQWVMTIDQQSQGRRQVVEFADKGECKLDGTVVSWEASGPREVVISSPEWSGKLTLTFDLKLESFVGRGSGDSLVRRGVPSKK